ncbi:hypothetical protein OIDMADRAFT_126316 [Oidiodendron maius Zn]|uniref:Major facilitator superfamily (MFS) profile domain-containing protein n=1 Tax=Oidiodendron maius (strain Zn) TaxID=913774 RepID=A0A0C3CLK9_OIDMZ|nr:hypothetical protein OIDMADRAFT_126316 [Oidiodendron maius Zn]
MQSFLQYRKYRLAIEQQLRRDQEKAITWLDNASQPSHTECSSTHEASDAIQFPLTSVPSATSEDGVCNENLGQDQTDNLAKTGTRYTARTALGHALAGIHARDRTTHEGKGSKVFVVNWDGEHDPLNPRNYSKTSRIWMTLLVSGIAFVVTVASSIDTAILPQASAKFGVSDVVESLAATGMYLIGFGLGAIFVGPFSETFGRNVVYVVTLVMFMIFIMASGLAPNIGAQIAFRFLAGFFGAAPLTCAGGSISDMWDSLERSYGFPIYAIPAFSGPVLGPVMGSYIGNGRIGSWRWTEWITLILAGLVLCVIVLFQKETYPPLLLKWKAQHLRRITGDDRFQAELEITKTTLWTRLKISLKRPFQLMSEPIVMLMALYLTVIYIVLFTFLGGYTYIFTETYEISQGLTNVIFVGMLIGILVAAPLVPFTYNRTKEDMKLHKSENGSHVNPEIRLWFAMLGAPAIPISLFWMGWSAYPSVSIWSPIIASALFGYGLICIFMSAYMYIIDSYEIYAASALTFVTITRYVAAGGMTVVSLPFYRNVGVHWTLSIMGCISLFLTPIPYILYKYGYVVRRRSNYAVSRI